MKPCLYLFLVTVLSSGCFGKKSEEIDPHAVTKSFCVDLGEAISDDDEKELFELLMDYDEVVSMMALIKPGREADDDEKEEFHREVVQPCNERFRHLREVLFLHDCQKLQYKSHEQDDFKLMRNEKKVLVLENPDEVKKLEEEAEELGLTKKDIKKLKKNLPKLKKIFSVKDLKITYQATGEQNALVVLECERRLDCGPDGKWFAERGLFKTLTIKSKDGSKVYDLESGDEIKPESESRDGE